MKKEHFQILPFGTYVFNSKDEQYKLYEQGFLRETGIASDKLNEFLSKIRIAALDCPPPLYLLKMIIEYLNEEDISRWRYSGRDIFELLHCLFFLAFMVLTPTSIKIMQYWSLLNDKSLSDDGLNADLLSWMAETCEEWVSHIPDCPYSPGKIQSKYICTV